MSRAFFVRVGFKSNFHDLNMRLLILKYKGGKSNSKGSHIMVPDMAWLVTDDIRGNDIRLKWCGIIKLVYVYVRYAQW